MCTNCTVFLQEKKTVDICTNCIVFLQEVKETVDMCTNCIVFFRRRKRQLGCVLIVLFFSGGATDCRHV